MAKAEQKTFAKPDQTCTFDFGRMEIVRIAGSDIGRLTLEPGWRWSSHVKPLAGTELCEAPHFQYQIAASLRHPDGRWPRARAGARRRRGRSRGDDAWVVGEPVVLVDWWGASDYARLGHGSIRSQ